MTFIRRILKSIGHKFENRFSWGELYPNIKHFECAMYFTSSNNSDDDAHAMLVLRVPFLFRLYLHLWKLQGGNTDHRYGFYVYNWRDDVVLCWRNKYTRISFPWQLKWKYTEYIDYNNEIVYQSRRGEFDPFELVTELKPMISETFSYQYTTKYGEIQHRYATVTIERRVYGWTWIPWITKSYKTIDVVFNQGVGSSSRGGVTMCGYDMLLGETAEMTLRRMEKERNFDR